MGFPPAGIFGYSRMTGGYAGGQAQYARVPHADVGPIKIENDLPDDKVLGAASKRTEPAFSTSAPSRERQAIRRSFTSFMITALHSTRFPAGALTDQCDSSGVVAVIDTG